MTKQSHKIQQGANQWDGLLSMCSRSFSVVHMIAPDTFTLLHFLSCNTEILMFERLPGVCPKFRRLLWEQAHCHNQYLASYISEEFRFSSPKITVD